MHKSFLAFLGQDIDIRQISPRIVTSYLSLRPSNSNWNKHRKNLCAFFEWCFRHGLIEKNPCLNVAKMPVEFNRKQIPTEEEMTRVIMAAGEHRPFLMVLFYTMARIDEILRLRWEDVNFQERIVKLWTKKTSDGSWRCDLFPMEEGLYQVLQGLWQKSRGNPEWVFFNPKTGDRYWDRRKIIKNICMKAGVRPFGYHAIRHFVASLLADRGKESMKTMQELLRHRRQSTTEIYLQKFDDNLRQAAGKIEGFFESSPQKFPAKEKEAGE